MDSFRSSFTVTRINGCAGLVSPDSAMETTSRLRVFVGLFRSRSMVAAAKDKKVAIHADNKPADS